MSGKNLKKFGFFCLCLGLAVATFLHAVRLPNHAAAAADAGRPVAKFQGGTGGSPASAIIITGVPDYVGAVAAEYQYLGQQFGSAPRSYQIIQKRVYQQGDKVYDVIRVELRTGIKQDFYFDITKYFKKP